MHLQLTSILMAIALVSSATLFYAPAMALSSCHVGELLIDMSGMFRCDCEGHIVVRKDGTLVCGGRCMPGAIYDAAREACIQQEPPEEILKRLEHKLDLLLERTRKE